MINKRRNKETSVSENQFDFMSKRSTMEVIHLLKRLIERYQEKKHDLHMFLLIWKRHDKVSRKILQRVVKRKVLG